MDQFDIYREYILNYKTALSTIRKCKASNEQFNNIFSKVCYMYVFIMWCISLIDYLCTVYSKIRQGIVRMDTVIFFLAKLSAQSNK